MYAQGGKKYIEKHISFLAANEMKPLHIIKGPFRASLDGGFLSLLSQVSFV
jgi:hypothetical protein